MGGRVATLFSLRGLLHLLAQDMNVQPPLTAVRGHVPTQGHRLPRIAPLLRCHGSRIWDRRLALFPFLFTSSDSKILTAIPLPNSHLIYPYVLCTASPEQPQVDPWFHPFLSALNLYHPPSLPQVMEQVHQDHHYLSDLDSGVGLRPSGLLPDNLNLSPNHTAFDSFDLRPSSPHFPATPSYNGSYHNSPYSAVSELDFDSKDDSLGLFNNDPLVIPPTEDYDPSKYDAPSSTGLLMFDDHFMSGVNDHNRVSVSITPAEDASSPAYYDHGSPGSSNGGAESGAENDRPSPASSVSSRLGVNTSPHLDFNQLRVESPYNPPVSMPSEGASPQMKAHSPPVLVIPDLNQPSGYQQDRPVIQAPQGDGVGPRLHIVPATPIGGVDTGQFRNSIPQGACPRGAPFPLVLIIVCY